MSTDDPTTPDSSIVGANAGLRGLKDPVVVVAFEGWNDAGSSASAAVEHLAETYDAELAFSIDPDDFYDFQVNRPEVSVDADGESTLAWPSTDVKTATLPDGRSLVLVQGVEPNLRWRPFSTLIVSALRAAGAERVVILGALLADTPHTRPVPVSVSSRDQSLAVRHWRSLAHGTTVARDDRSEALQPKHVAVGPHALAESSNRCNRCNHDGNSKTSARRHNSPHTTLVMRASRTRLLVLAGRLSSRFQLRRWVFTHVDTPCDWLRQGRGLEPVKPVHLCRPVMLEPADEATVT